MFEFDRTRRPSKQAERLQRYDWLLTVGWRESRYASLDIEPAVLIVCAERRDVKAFVRAADRHLSASVSRAGNQSATEEFFGREQIGFTDREMLASGGTRLLQLLPDAQIRRQSSGALQDGYVEQRLGIDRLFSSRRMRLVDLDLDEGIVIEVGERVERSALDFQRCLRHVCDCGGRANGLRHATHVLRGRSGVGADEPLEACRCGAGTRPRSDDAVCLV